MEFDTIITHGRVIDGSGEAEIKTDIGIIGDKIVAMGNLAKSNAQINIDASGKIVCPGFIDVHVHSELALLGGIDQYAPLKMGVTTQLASPDGFSWAPLSKQRLMEVTEYLHVFYDDANIYDKNNISLQSFLSIFQGNIPSNIALQVPHLSVRAEVMGWESRTATKEELEQMGNIVHEWLEAGAVSFCTGLEYEPMRHATTEELIYLSKITAQYDGIYVAHQRGYGSNVSIGCNETFQIAEEASIPVHISHFTIDELAKVEMDRAMEQQIDVTFDMYPYPAGCTHLLMGLPPSIQAGSPSQVKAKLRNKTIRKEMATHIEEAFPLDRVVFAAIGSEHPTGWEGKSLGEVTKLFGSSLTDTVCDILLMTDLQALMVYHWELERHPYLKTTFTHPLHMIATDGIYVGEKPHPRGYGSYPKVLAEFVRENNWLSYEEAIYKMSGFPASRFNIKRRGILKEGNYADIVIFDPNTISSPATFEQARKDPEGIAYVFVNGKKSMINGKPTAGMNGKII